MERYLVVLITCPSVENAMKIKDVLLKNKLAACINILSNVSSFFRWEGKIERAKEVLMIIKTRKELMKKLISAVKKIHKYTVPEIISIPITEGKKDYLKRITDSLKD